MARSLSFLEERESCIFQTPRAGTIWFRCAVRWFVSGTEETGSAGIKSATEAGLEDHHGNPTAGASSSSAAGKDDGGIFSHLWSTISSFWTGKELVAGPEFFPPKWYSLGAAKFGEPQPPIENDMFELKSRGDGWLNPDGFGLGKYRDEVRLAFERARLRSVILGPICRLDVLISKARMPCLLSREDFRYGELSGWAIVLVMLSLSLCMKNYVTNTVFSKSFCLQVRGSSRVEPSTVVRCSEHCLWIHLVFGAW